MAMEKKIEDLRRAREKQFHFLREHFCKTRQLRDGPSNQSFLFRSYYDYHRISVKVMGDLPTSIPLLSRNQGGFHHLEICSMNKENLIIFAFRLEPNENLNGTK